MLVCRACNTRYEKGTRTCPSCGRRAPSSSSEFGAGESASLSLSNPLKPKPKAKPKPKPRAAEIDLELDESASPAAAPKEKKAQAAPTPAPAVQLEAGIEQVKLLLGEDPGLLERGLSIYTDEEGEFVGGDFATAVGSIDLLCRDGKGGFVVVELPLPDEIAESVSAILRRMGWVRKHLAEDGDDVRGVVVLEQLPEELAYAAAGSGGAIVFKGFKLGLSFHDLEE